MLQPDYIHHYFCHFIENVNFLIKNNSIINFLISKKVNFNVIENLIEFKMQSWNSYTEDFEIPDQSIPSLAPSLLKDVWEDSFEVPTGSVSNDLHVILPNSSDLFPPEPSKINHVSSSNYISPPRGPHTAPSSPQRLSFSASTSTIVTNNINDNNREYCSVQFHPNRIQILAYSPALNLKLGDYVITDADRGFDIGVVKKINEHPSSKDAKMAKIVTRKASPEEAQQIPLKEEKEKAALELCQEKVLELGLPMHITGAEYQFDGKKLTFYYAASSYVDFRNLVRSLFRIFGTRIWMVWYDGTAPVKDVLTKTETRNT